MGPLMRSRLRASCAALLALLPCLSFAQDAPPAVLTEQRGGTYVRPPEKVDPKYLPTGPDARPDVAAGPPALSLQLTFEMPLRSGGSANLGRGTQGSTAASPNLQALVRWHPIRGSYWFVQGVFYKYLRGDRQQAWHPDFTYSFGYDDWHPDTWSLVYANYTGTRFQPAAGESRFNFSEGQWTLGYKFALPQRLEPWLLVGDGDSSTCGANLHFMPRYVEFTTGGTRSGKTSASLACRYMRPSGWYADLAVFAYADRSQQQPWDPDFTYGFGYFDSRPGTLSLKYNNYSGNRFPGRSRGAGEGTFRSGSISLTWSGEW
jgi:hypothetical protein